PAHGRGRHQGGAHLRQRHFSRERPSRRDVPGAPGGDAPLRRHPHDPHLVHGHDAGDPRGRRLHRDALVPQPADVHVEEDGAGHVRHSGRARRGRRLRHHRPAPFRDLLPGGRGQRRRRRLDQLHAGGDLAVPPTLGWQRLRWAQLGAADSYLVTRDELAALGTGLLKNTTGTGVLSIAVGGTDYVVPGGVAGGQTIKGGTAAGENLTLQSTANATKGQTVIGVSGTDVNIDEVNHRFGLGVAAPETTVDIAGAISARGTNTISSAVDRIFMAYESGAVGGMAANSGRIEASRFGTFRELYLRGANVILQAGGSSAPYPLKAWSTGNVTINNNTDVATSALRVSGARTVASGASAVWDGVDFIASTLTISGSTNITTAAGVNFV